MSGRLSYARVLAAVALTLGLGAAASCTSDAGGPTAPSPGRLTSGEGSGPAEASPTPEGPGLSAPGIRLTAVPRGDGSFDITEEVVLRVATVVIQLEPPPSGERLQGMMVATLPQATNLKVFADDNQLPLAKTELDHGEDLSLDNAVTKLKLTYRLKGSSARSLPSRVGRALAAISPLTARTDGSLPTNMTVSGGSLLNVVCPLLQETRCAVGEPPGLGIQQGIPAEQALAVLQLDLPMQP
ncbi:hypothetical protein EV643_104216 [Kribbella sp. VKM Ac-2527]|uniref:Lipoprotein n=1 Tax=Kribbella caucasensis TaxID=2512215 RepID=A0A4R6KJR7_9ACTN|nr:hypothetical protein [Kribbella sp. VKM Ac-2527]TDO50722.1 hypothetical protein EV643_104216 [Kribbella sp. VKM Ac-2527]